MMRRHLDPNVSFGDLVAAQQTLVTDVATYLATLGQLWSSVVTVADFLQTDDLFQLGKPLPVPELPDLEKLPGWMCEHPCGHTPQGNNSSGDDARPFRRHREYDGNRPDNVLTID